MNKLTFLFLGLAMSTLFACNSENEDDLLPDDEVCQDNNATLTNHVIPIISTNCAVQGCHVSGTGRVDFTVKENIIQNASTIRSFTQNGIMPPPSTGNTLTAQQKQNIFCWVENGAMDN